jgi:glycosyltransferase involved in cell wall biosynthesis
MSSSDLVFPQFSVLMSLYHAEKPSNLEACLESLRIQTALANQVVIVFDGPISISLERVVDKWRESLNIETLKLPKNIGLGGALNKGLQLCEHNFVARMDTDDVCQPNRFERQLFEFMSDSTLSLCGANTFEFSGTPENVISTRNVPASQDQIIQKCIFINPFNHPTIMFKKEDVLQAGGYKPLPWMEDWYLWLRMLALGYKGLNIEEYLVRVRTGYEMIARRAGWSYVKSEWLITKVKVGLGFTNWPMAIVIFIIRSAPRLLPQKLLMPLYLYTRKKVSVN